MKSKVIDGSLDLIKFQPKIFSDKRGYFIERFNQSIFKKVVGRNLNVLQQNESESKKNTLRGLHYQYKNTQGKLISVIEGEILDVVVDVRKQSQTFGKYFSIKLSGANKESLWIPRGYAHGFLVISSKAIFSYLVDNIYDPSSEETILWNDKVLNIKWGLEKPLVSEKDKKGKNFLDANHL